jgi:mannan endo-1,4-beta-mannosidase
MTTYLPARRPRGYRSPHERRRHRVFVTMATAVVLAVAAGGLTEILTSPNSGYPLWGPRHPIVIALPTRSTSYIGAYAPGVPASYAPMNSFRAAISVQPNIALYYSGWYEPFKLRFALKAWVHHAVPLVQIDPGHVSLAAIAAGRYDSYLHAFAEAVGDFGQQTGCGVIIGFGHEPNGFWYPWGNGYQSPAAWKAAWRHIVTLFRRQGVDDVTWLWTVNVIDKKVGIVSPDRWWPGSRYVTWVGIDGYYYRPSAKFASLFGPTINAIHNVTRDPILVSETGAQAKAGKPVKIADVFHGVSSYGLLGLVWFNVRGWRLDTRASAAAFAAAAKNWRLSPG